MNCSIRSFVVLFVGLLCSCSESTPPTITSHEAPPSPITAMPEAPPLEHGATLRLKAVDLDGKPLPGMVPIATRNANATDYPVANGSPTAADGASTLAVPAGELVYVRMWDPTFHYFANNYFDVDVDEDVPDQVLEVVMVRSASLRMTLISKPNTPAANQNVGLMMFHPAKGAWWPDESTADSEGVVRFDHVPAGRYTVKLKTLTAGSTELADLILPPGADIDLGAITLQPDH